MSGKSGSRGFLRGVAPAAVLLAGVLFSGTMAGAVTADLTLDRFGRKSLADAQAAMADFRSTQTIRNLHLETFEDRPAWNGSSGSSNPQKTRVGDFNAFGTTGSGQAAINNGTAAEVRGDNDMFWGRYNTDPPPVSPLSGHWLDSNDNRGMKWKISGIGKFDTVAFFITDAADVGGKFTIKAGKSTYSDIAGGKRLKNGNIHFVRLALSETVDKLTVRLEHDRSNDGFGVDGALVGRVAPIPVPPAGFLLATGIAGFALLRRRRKTRAI